jgi:hypothetical protein
MKTTTVLDMLSDFVTDALNDEKHSPEEIVDAIRSSISEWVEYHRVQGEKAERVLELLNGYGNQTLGYDTITGEEVVLRTPSVDKISFDSSQYPYNPLNINTFV